MKRRPAAHTNAAPAKAGGRPRALSRLYEADETAWLDKSAALIRSGRHDRLDYENLASYLEDMARRDRHEIRSRLKILLIHLLKRDHQPEMQSRSWDLTIANQRDELKSELTATLRNHAEAILGKAYESAVKLAAMETGLRKDTFPKECPYTLDEILADE